MRSREEVRGKRVAIQFDAHKCIYSRHCVLDRPYVFVPNAKGEWINRTAPRPTRPSGS